MFGHRFYGRRMYGPRYFGDGGGVAVVAPPVEAPAAVDERGQFAEYPLKPWNPPEPPRPGFRRFSERVYLLPEPVSLSFDAAVRPSVIQQLAPVGLGLALEFLVGASRWRMQAPEAAWLVAFLGAPQAEQVNPDRLADRLRSLEAEALEREEWELLGL